MSVFINEYWLKPYAHAIGFLVLNLLIFVLMRPRNANALYTIAGVVYVVFILTNSILIFFAPNTWSYFFTSLLFSVIYLFFVAPLCSLYIRIANLDGSGESAMMFLVIIYHPFALLVVIGLNWLIA